MKPISRRQALGLAGLGGLSVVVGGVGLSRTHLARQSTTGGGEVTFVEPEVLRSREGRLSVELVAAPHEVHIAGQQAQLLTYNGSVPGQTWRVRPGDRIEVRLINDLDTPTNLHTHGLEVSPRDNGDNPFISIDPGQSFDYRFDLPEDHPPGVFWYHPHRHGTATGQLFGGLYGALIVEGDEVPATRERVLVISDLSLDTEGEPASVSAPEVMMGREGELLLVNGQHRPHLAARQGQRERWRVVNACTSRYLRLALTGQQVVLMGIDRSQEPVPRGVEEVTLAPGNRADLLVTMSAGTSQLRTLSYDRGGMGRMGRGGLSGAATLASLTVSGESATTPLPPVPRRPPVPDLRGQPVDAQREITFTMNMAAMMSSTRSMMEMGFDGRSFDPDRIDQQVGLGTVEEWVIVNPTPMDHPFHLHIWPMQVIEEAGQTVSDPTWRDVVNVPSRGRVSVLVDFARHPGRSVYHCHILDHEDSGMMASVEVG
ncbi:multicopper oxidase family protein [Nesterenkonia sphaerica]|uniref:Multicopper oxidase family protein n=1 Tax=Nesterenkonia sphaerica TaxID=1804988 RepID=A0A5R9A697_9MICC|nr:multicopper oxidase family protein [Nesterenkonia sphaerica]TLP74201.1 multicopper oxidase family protein [Nesterenkonia sphaerica]